MQFLGGNADFRAESEFAAVGKAGACVVIDHRGIHFGEEFFRRRFVFGDDALAVAGGIAVNVVNRFFQAVHDMHRKDIVKIFGRVIFFGRRFYPRQNRARGFVAAQFDVFLVEFRF